MNINEFYTNDAIAKQLVSKVFPEYRGNKYKVEEFDGPMQLPSFWDSGSKDYWAVINLSNNNYKLIPENGNPFSNGGKIFKISTLPSNFAVINYHVGRVENATIYINKENLSKMLPQETNDLTWAEKVVLSATRSYKSSYMGRSDNRFYEANQEVGISKEEYAAAKQSLISKKLLNNAGAITIDGRNAIGNTNLWSLKKT